MTITLGSGGESDPKGLTWLDGEGQSHVYPAPGPGQPGQPNTTTWWYDVAGSPFSRFRYTDESGVYTLERYTAHGYVTRYEKIPGAGGSV